MIQNLFLKKACLVNFHHLNESDCAQQNDSSTADDVQRYVSDLNVYAALLQNVPSIFFVLFVGPWSDKNGRKIAMMLPLLGQILSVALYFLNDHFESWPAEFLLFASIPLGLCGGPTSIFMILNR